VTSLNLSKTLGDDRSPCEGERTIGQELRILPWIRSWPEAEASGGSSGEA
jgi:hypothetical protein